LEQNANIDTFRFAMNRYHYTCNDDNDTCQHTHHHIDDSLQKVCYWNGLWSQ